MKKFKDSTLVQKVQIIEDVLDKEVRFFLQNDGGDCEVVDVKEEDKTQVYLRYMGACSGCGGIEGTVRAIQGILQDKISKDIVVLSV